MRVLRARSLAYWQEHVWDETHDRISPGRAPVPAEKQVSLADHCVGTGDVADTSA
jgi:hypothetical protein